VSDAFNPKRRAVYVVAAVHYAACGSSAHDDDVSDLQTTVLTRRRTRANYGGCCWNDTDCYVSSNS